MILHGYLQVAEGNVVLEREGALRLNNLIDTDVSVCRIVSVPVGEAVLDEYLRKLVSI